MDMAKWPGKMWPISHKPIAVASGLGAMGHHHLVIHPRFGNFIVLGTILFGKGKESFGGFAAAKDSHQGISASDERVCPLFPILGLS
jgi:hypothetical protein